MTFFQKVAVAVMAAMTVSPMPSWADELVNIQTRNSAIVLKIKDDGRVEQAWAGRRLAGEARPEDFPDGPEAYVTRGEDTYFEPALDVIHSDGNPTTWLRYESRQEKALAPGVKETVLTLEDAEEPLRVVIHYVAYENEDVIKTWTEITNLQKKPVQLKKFASSMLHFRRKQYFLTQFDGDWACEARMTTLPLSFGKKVLDSNLGSRADMFIAPQFVLSFDGEASEKNGECLLGQIGWTGNFRFTFEVDNTGSLRVLSGINDEFSERSLAPKETFRTADFYFTYSGEGLGKASRNFHDWAREYQVLDGKGDRLTLLNNWEATYFDFDEERLLGLMDDAVELGVDMFLLDDGWFGNKYPRGGDTSGLGDWTETTSKLPNGIARLCEGAKERGIRFGLWIEPEMVNTRSELFEKHRDWVLLPPNREPRYFRNQLVLDLANPEVQDFVFGVVDGLLTRYPDIAFFKWDCNSPVMNIYSPYLKGRQTHLPVDYVRGLYSVLERVRAKYPDIPMMMCSGGSGRIDYKGLEYFTEFWASDNTDPVSRLFIQHAYSLFYPSKTICAHVTSWNKDAGIKFRTDVASMGKLGFDIKLSDLDESGRTFVAGAVANYRRLKGVILDGDLYRLVSPYEGEHAASIFVSKDRSKAVLFAFDVFPEFGEQLHNVTLDGLDPARRYHISEINLFPGVAPRIKERTLSGDYLMKVGLDVFTTGRMSSCVLELTAQ